MKIKTIVFSFIKDLINLPDWSGPKSLSAFSAMDWDQLRGYLADTNTLNPADTALMQAAVAALGDSEHWAEEAQNGTLPDIDALHLDWDLSGYESIGITAYDLQELSFEFAKRKFAAA